MTFSNTSKTLRKEKGLSQVQLAEALNISKACISIPIKAYENSQILLVHSLL